MSAKHLSSRAIIGEFYRHLEQDAGNSWINQVSMQFQSDNDSETYLWLGQSPVMRPWTGGRKTTGFIEQGFTITNRHFEATVEVLLRELRRDKTGQIMIRIRELAERTNTHWAKLLTELIMKGEKEKCYDDKPFFSAKHQENESGLQSNHLTLPLSVLPIPETEKGNLQYPSVKTIKFALMKGVQQILSFKDDKNEPINENASRFLAMVPTCWMDIANAAINSSVLSGAETNDLAATRNFSLKYVVNPRLTWTDKFVLFRTDGSIAPLIRQEETPVQLKAIAEGSELEFKEDKHQYGVDTWRNVGYGYWQKACLVQLTQAEK